MRRDYTAGLQQKNNVMCLPPNEYSSVQSVCTETVGYRTLGPLNFSTAVIQYAKCHEMWKVKNDDGISQNGPQNQQDGFVKRWLRFPENKIH